MGEPVIRNSTIVHVCHEAVRQLASGPIACKISILPRFPLMVGNEKRAGIRKGIEEAPVVWLTIAVALRAVSLNHIPSNRSRCFRGLDAVENILHSAARAASKV